MARRRARRAHGRARAADGRHRRSRALRRRGIRGPHHRTRVRVRRQPHGLGVRRRRGPGRHERARRRGRRRPDRRGARSRASPRTRGRVRPRERPRRDRDRRTRRAAGLADPPAAEADVAVVGYPFGGPLELQGGARHGDRADHDLDRRRARRATSSRWRPMSTTATRAARCSPATGSSAAWCSRSRRRSTTSDSPCLAGHAGAARRRSAVAQRPRRLGQLRRPSRVTRR